MESIGLLQEVSKRDGVGGRIVEALAEAASLLGSDLTYIEKELFAICDAAPSDLDRVCRHLVDSGGKHVRPILCLLAFRAVHGQGTLPTDLAVTCELLHNATLLHDDVIDEGNVRRGRTTARVVYGNALSVLGGDYLLIKTIEMVSRRGPEYMGPFVWTLNQLVRGELAQLKRRGSVETTEDEYFGIIEGKTASLFRWAVQSGALAAGAEPRFVEAVCVFGWHVGIAFQLMDDVLDFTADVKILGKSLLSDIQEGKMTLPVILAARESTDLRTLLRQLVRDENPLVIIPKVMKIVNSGKIVEEVKSHAVAHTEKGLAALGSATGFDSKILDTLSELASALLERAY